MKCIKSVMLLLALFLIQEVNAQSGGFAGNATRIGFSPSSMAMANAVSADASNGIYPVYNPSLAAISSDKRQVDLTSSSLEFDRIFQTAGVHFQLPPNAGISFGIIRTGVNDIDERTVSGYSQGSFNTSEYQLTTAFGLRLSEKLYAGVGFKLNYADYHDDLEAATAVSVDLGFLYHLSQDLKLGLTIQDLFANYIWNSADLYGLSQTRNVINNFPVRYKTALSFQKEKFTINTELEIQSYISESPESEIFITDKTPPGTIQSDNVVNTNAVIMRTGASWNAHERLTLRSGYRLSDAESSNKGNFSAGFSLHLPFDTFSPSIDYAFVMEPNSVSNMHVFALRLHL